MWARRKLVCTAIFISELILNSQFLLVMDEVTRDKQGGIPWCMLFADDVVLVDESRTGVD
jgi:hypothetical protein